MTNPETSMQGWRKSSYSSGQGGECVEIASRALGVTIRDSKDPGGPALTIDRPAFAALLQDIRAGSLDL